MDKLIFGHGTTPRGVTLDSKGFAEYHAQCVERVEDNPENWPELSDLPEADTSDLVRAAQYQSTIDADFELS